MFARARLLHTEAFRHAAIFAAIFFAATLVIIFLVYVIADDALKGELLRAVDNDIAAVRNGYYREGGGDWEAAEIIGYRLRGPGAQDYFLFERGANRKLAGNLPAMTPGEGILFLARTRGGRIAVSDERHGQIVGRGVFIAPGAYLYVGRDLRVTHATAGKILRASGWIAAAAILLGILGGALVSSGFLARMDAITRTCRAIMAGRLTERIPVRGTRDEIDRLASTINEMLDRIAALMDSLRQVTTDIAHDLRTPLTHLRNRLEDARSNARTTEEFAGAVEAAIADSEQVLAMFSGLLRIAQIESGARRAGFAPVELHRLLSDVAGFYRPVIEDNEDSLVENLDTQVTVVGDKSLLWQMFANLIENTINHTPPGTRISVSLQASREGATVTIADNGPGIPEQHRAQVFKRFYRLDQSRGVRGYGLGLPLVSAIAELHSAKIDLEDNLPGVRATIRFPTIRTRETALETAKLRLNPQPS